MRRGRVGRLARPVRLNYAVFEHKAPRDARTTARGPRSCARLASPTAPFEPARRGLEARRDRLPQPSHSKHSHVFGFLLSHVHPRHSQNVISGYHRDRPHVSTTSRMSFQSARHGRRPPSPCNLASAIPNGYVGSSISTLPRLPCAVPAGLFSPNSLKHPGTGTPRLARSRTLALRSPWNRVRGSTPRYDAARYFHRPTCHQTILTS